MICTQQLNSSLLCQLINYFHHLSGIKHERNSINMAHILWLGFYIFWWLYEASLAFVTPATNQTQAGFSEHAPPAFSHSFLVLFCELQDNQEIYSLIHISKSKTSKDSCVIFNFSVELHWKHLIFYRITAMINKKIGKTGGITNYRTSPLKLVLLYPSSIWMWNPNYTLLCAPQITSLYWLVSPKFPLYIRLLPKAISTWYYLQITSSIWMR